MNSQYQSMSRSARSVAAVAAIATVVALFDFVAGLGDTKSEALAELNAAAPVMTVASAKTASEAATVAVQ